MNAIKPIGLMLSLVIPALPALAGTTLGHAPAETVIYFTDVAQLRHQAEIGDSEAQLALGYEYLRPSARYGLPQSDRQARFWFRRAARQGHGAAAYNLAVMSIQGIGTQRDLVRALAWLEIAAANGHESSRELIPEVTVLLDAHQQQQAVKMKDKLVPASVLGDRI